MKKTFSLFLLLIFSLKLSAQNNEIDSLDNLISRATSDTQRINLTVKKIHALANSNLDSAIIVGNKAIEETKAIDYKKGEGNVRVILAYAYNVNGKYAAARENLNIAKDILLQTKDSTAITNLYNGFGIMYMMQSKNDSAVFFYEKAFAVAQSQNNLYLIATVGQNIAITYQQLSNYPQALTYYQKALTAAEKQKDEESEAYIYINMGITFFVLDDTGRAEQYYLRSLDLAKKIDNKYLQAYAYSNLSSLYSDRSKYMEQYKFGVKGAKLAEEVGDPEIEAMSLGLAATALAAEKKFKDAEKLCLRAINIADSSGSPHYILQTHGDMGHILILQNKYAEAIPYYEKAFKSITDADLYDEQGAGFYLSLSDCYEKTGNYRKALATHKIYSRAKDSLSNKENIRRATELTLNYEFEKKQQLAKAEQGEKDAEAKRIKTQQYFIIAALCVIVLAALVIAFIQYRHTQQKQKANALLHQQKEKLETTLAELKLTQAHLLESEKEKLEAHHHKKQLELEAQALRAQMNPHFIFNCMNSIKALIQQKEEEKAIIYLTAFSKLIRTIFQNSDKLEITLFDEIETCKLYTQLESMRFGNKFNYNFSLDETIDLKLVTVPPLIIQPFIENAIWHGIMPKEDTGILNVILKKENDVVICVVEDNGIGREVSLKNKDRTGTTSHESRGVHLTQTRLDLDNSLNDRNASVHMVDRKDKEGNAEGTSVILKFIEY